MTNLPFSVDLLPSPFRFDRYDQHLRRTLQNMRGQFCDQAAWEEMFAREDTLLYEVLELHRPEVDGELLSGLSIVHPGKVGDEYFMTKGHFHTVLDTAEIYHCLQGEGYMVMETQEGEWAVEKLSQGKILYVPPGWAHRSVNCGTVDLVTFFVYPAHAGHDYGTIERQGFRKLVVERDGEPAIIDNPRWSAPGAGQ